MTDIVKREETALSHLKPNMRLITTQELDELRITDPNMKEILKAQMTPRIHNELPKDIEKTVSRILIITLERLGQKNLEPERALVIENDFVKYLKSRYFNWSLQEVEMACRMGALGELGEISRHLTSQVLIQWMESFDKKVRAKASRTLNMAIQEHNRTKELGMGEEAAKMTREQKIKFVEEAFDKWLLNESVPGSIIFKQLEELEWIKYSTEKKWELIKESIETLKLKNTALLDNEALRHDARERLSLLEKVEIGKAKTVPDFLKVESQRMGMELFFIDCHRMEMRPKDLTESEEDPGGDPEEPFDVTKGSPINQVSLNQYNH